jgi:hypothetical protein
MVRRKTERVAPEEVVVHEENPIPWLVGLVFVFLGVAAFDVALILFEDSGYDSNARAEAHASTTEVATR